MEESLLPETEGRLRSWAVTWGMLVLELKNLSYIAAPVGVVYMSQYLLQVTSLVAVGHLGELSLSSVAIAIAFTNVTGFSFLSGLAGGLETLCGQAYGAQQYQKLGTYTYSAIISLILVCFPISILWIFMDKLLILLGQDPLISHEARKYSLWLIPGLCGSAIAKPVVWYFQSQKLVFPMLISSVIILCLYVPICWGLVFELGLGNLGAAVATSLSYLLCALFLAMFVRYNEACESSRTPLSKDAFLGIWEFFRFAIPSAIMVWFAHADPCGPSIEGHCSKCLDYKFTMNNISCLCKEVYRNFLKWWSIEALTLLSGLLPNPKLETSVISICLAISTMQVMVSTGFGIAASTQVSNELGSGDPMAAKLACWAAVSLALTQAIIVSTILLFCQNVLGYAYRETSCGIYCLNGSPSLSLIIMDSFQAVLFEVARGSGWQHVGAYVNLGAFYIVGIPVGVILGFVIHMRAEGLWIGIVMGSTLQSAVLSVISSFTNWEKQATNARRRIFESRSSSQREWVEVE